MQLSRRAILLSGAALAVLGGLGLELGWLPGAGPGWRVLSAEEAAVAEALGGALFPAGNPLGVAAAEVDFVTRVDDLLADTAEPELVPAFRYLLRAVQLSGLPHGAPFTELGAEARRAVVAEWEDPANLARRMGFEVLKVLVGMAFFNHPAVRAAIGWRASCASGVA